MHEIGLADQLAETRAEIKLLRQREAALRAAILGWDGPVPDGRWSRVEIAKVKARVFDRALLPIHVQEDPQFWRDRITTYVKCLPVQVAGSRPGGSRFPTQNEPAIQVRANRTAHML